MSARQDSDMAGGRACNSPGTTLETSDFRAVTSSETTRVVRDVLVSSQGSLDSGLSIDRYQDDDGDGDAVSSDCASSCDSDGLPALNTGCEMAVKDITLTDSSANIGIFKNYVIMCEGVDALPALPALPGLDALPASALMQAKEAHAKTRPTAARRKWGENGDTSKSVDAVITTRKWLRWPWACATSAAVPAAILIVVGVTFLLQPTSQDDDGDRADVVIQLPNGVEYASRGVWKAIPPKRQMPTLAMPSSGVIVHHTATAACYTTSACIEKVAAMQLLQMDSGGRDWADIGYNFVVGGDGVVYEGRGWDHVGGHFEKEIWSHRTVGVAVIGNFVDTEPPEGQLVALRQFLSWATTVGKVASDYKLYGVCQLMATRSPGRRLMAQLRTWPHWDSFVMQPNVSCTE